MYYIKKNKQKYNVKSKLSRKNSISELLLPTKTKKNKQVYHIINKKKKNLKDGNSGSGGGGVEGGHENEHWEGSGGSGDSVKNDKSKEILSYEVKTKHNYRWLRVKVRWHITLNFGAKLIGLMTQTQYDLTRHLLWAKVHLAKMKLYSAKMYKFLFPLIGKENAAFKIIRNMIKKIYDIQLKIEDTDAIEKDKYKLFRFKRPQLIEKLLKTQDKFRKKLNKYIMFNSIDEISVSTCKNLNLKRALATPLVLVTGAVGLGLRDRYRESKKIICALAKYRKTETKFNKYYKKFKNQYDEFVVLYPLCNNLLSASPLKYLDITIDSTKGETELIDKTKCDFEKLDRVWLESFDVGVKNSEKQLGKSFKKKTIDRKKALDRSYESQNKSFTGLVNNFNVNLENFKKIFIKNESYGLRHYHGLPKKKSRQWKRLALYKTDEYTGLFIDKKNLGILSKNNIFIKDFTNMITKFGNDVKNIFNPGENQEIGVILPEITINTTDGTSTEKADKENFKVFSINLDKYKGMINFKTDNFETIVKPQIQSDKMPYVVCVQNGTSEMKDTNGVFVNSFFSGNYISVAYSKYAGDKYNIIYVRESIIDKNFINLKEIKPMDQTSHFVLNELPESMPLDIYQKSFAVVKIIYGSVSQKKEIIITTTELIGSKEEDIRHIRAINSYKNTVNQVQTNGLRDYQIKRMLALIQRYTATDKDVDIICGDFGGSIKINDSNIDNYYAQYIKTYPDMKSIIQKNDITEYYKNGMSDNLSIYKYMPNHDSRSQIQFTHKDTNIISNYIFYKANVGKEPNYGFTNTQRIDDFGGILPIAVNLNVTGGNTYNSNKGNLIRKNLNNIVELYTKDELHSILKMLDKLMSNFAYGYKPYVVRDLGCFSFNKNSNFSKRDNANFYLMNYPSFMEVIIYQMCGSYNVKTSSDERLYYNENQVSFVDTHSAIEKHPLFIKIEKKIKEETTSTNSKPDPEFNQIDILSRMLLIPRKSLKFISGINIGLNSQKEKNQTSPKEYKKLSRMFCENFYRNKGLGLLEKQITNIMRGTDGNKGSGVSIESDKSVGNTNFIKRLIELDNEGKLKNIRDISLIQNLFEFIFIMLKLKFIDKQIDRDVEARKEEEQPISDIEKQAIETSKYTQKTNIMDSGFIDIFDNLMVKSQHSLEELFFDKSVDTTDLSDHKIITNPNSVFVKVTKDMLVMPTVAGAKLPELPKDDAKGLLALETIDTFIAYTLNKAYIPVFKLLRSYKSSDPDEQFNTLQFANEIKPIEDLNLDEIKDKYKNLRQTLQVQEDQTVADKVVSRIDLNFNKLKDLKDNYFEYCKKVDVMMLKYIEAIKILNNFENTNDIVIINDLKTKIDPIKKAIDTNYEEMLKLNNINFTNQMKKIKETVDAISEKIQGFDTVPIAVGAPAVGAVGAVVKPASPIQSTIEIDTSIILPMEIINKMLTPGAPAGVGAPATPLEICKYSIQYAFMIINKIDKLVKLSLNELQNIKYLCNLIEIGYNNMKEYILKNPVANSDMYINTYEYLNLVAKIIYNICHLLAKENSYDIKPPLKSIPIEKYLNELVVKLIDILTKHITDSNNYEQKQIGFYIITTPLYLVIDLIYYVSNCYCNPGNRKTGELSIIDGVTISGGRDLSNSLHARYKSLNEFKKKLALCKSFMDIKKGFTDTDTFIIDLKKQLLNAEPLAIVTMPPAGGSGGLKKIGLGETYSKYLEMINLKEDIMGFITDHQPELIDKNGVGGAAAAGRDFATVYPLLKIKSEQMEKLFNDNHKHIRTLLHDINTTNKKGMLEIYKNMGIFDNATAQNITKQILQNLTPSDGNKEWINKDPLYPNKGLTYITEIKKRSTDITEVLENSVKALEIFLPAPADRKYIIGLGSQTIPTSPVSQDQLNYRMTGLVEDDGIKFTIPSDKILNFTPMIEDENQYDTVAKAFQLITKKNLDIDNNLQIANQKYREIENIKVLPTIPTTPANILVAARLNNQDNIKIFLCDSLIVGLMIKNPKTLEVLNMVVNNIVKYDIPRIEYPPPISPILIPEVETLVSSPGIFHKLYKGKTLYLRDKLPNINVNILKAETINMNQYNKIEILDGNGVDVVFTMNQIVPMSSDIRAGHNMTYNDGENVMVYINDIFRIFWNYLIKIAVANTDAEAKEFAKLALIEYMNGDIVLYVDNILAIFTLTIPTVLSNDLLIAIRIKISELLEYMIRIFKIAYHNVDRKNIALYIAKRYFSDNGEELGEEFISGDLASSYIYLDTYPYLITAVGVLPPNDPIILQFNTYRVHPHIVWAAGAPVPVQTPAILPSAAAAVAGTNITLFNDYYSINWSILYVNNIIALNSALKAVNYAYHVVQLSMAIINCKLSGSIISPDPIILNSTNPLFGIPDHIKINIGKEGKLEVTIDDKYKAIDEANKSISVATKAVITGINSSSKTYLNIIFLYGRKQKTLNHYILSCVNGYRSVTYNYNEQGYNHSGRLLAYASVLQLASCSRLVKESQTILNSKIDNLIIQTGKYMPQDKNNLEYMVAFKNIYDKAKIDLDTYVIFYKNVKKQLSMSSSATFLAMEKGFYIPSQAAIAVTTIPIAGGAASNDDDVAAVNEQKLLKQLLRVIKFSQDFEEISNQELDAIDGYNSLRTDIIKLHFGVIKSPVGTQIQESYSNLAKQINNIIGIVSNIREIRKFAKIYIIELYNIYIIYQYLGQWIKDIDNTPTLELQFGKQKFSESYQKCNLFNSFSNVKNKLEIINNFSDINMYYLLSHLDSLNKNGNGNYTFFNIINNEKNSYINLDKIIKPSLRSLGEIDDLLLTYDSDTTTTKVTISDPIKYPPSNDDKHILVQYRNLKKDLFTLLATYNENNNDYSLFTELSYINPDIYTKVMNIYSKYIGYQEINKGVQYKNDALITLGPFKTCENVDEMTKQFNLITDKYTSRPMSGAGVIPPIAGQTIAARVAANQVEITDLYNQYVYNIITNEKAILQTQLNDFKDSYKILATSIGNRTFLSGGGKHSRTKKNKINIDGLFTFTPNKKITKLSKLNIQEHKFTKKQNLQLQKTEDKKSKTISHNY